MPPPLKKTIYTGNFVHTPSLGSLSVLEKYAIAVDEEGVIRHIEQLEPEVEVVDQPAKVVAKYLGWEGCEVVRAGRSAADKEGVWWFPGFVDTHIHASQHPNSGIIGKTTLLSWLTTYTFPLESSLSSHSKARQVYNRCISQTLSCGTTTAAYYATTHVSSTNILADICLKKGQRAFIGRCNMDSDMNPEYYRDSSANQAISDTFSTIEHIKKVDPANKLITPIITPRFAPSCTSSLLSSLGQLAKEQDLQIQTHISENTSEIALVASLFPAQKSYAAVYDAHNLLTPRTVLAHGVHLSADERNLIKARKSKISHCPVSNTSISSGLCPVRELLDAGIEVGLGTDVSGGYSSSILVAAREAGMVSRIIASLYDSASSGQEPQKETLPVGDVETAEKAPANAKNEGDVSVADRKKLSVEETLYLATRGGANCLNLGHKIGAFEVGMQWDAQLIRLHEIDDSASEAHEEADGGDLGEEGIEEDRGVPELWGKETWEEKVAKWVIGGDDRNTKMVFVAGRLVHWRS